MARRKLRPHQPAALKYMEGDRMYSALFMQQRLGKIIVTLRDIERNKVDKILIIAPYETFNGWINDLTAEHEIQYGLTIVEGTAKKRNELLFDKSKYFMINTQGTKVVPEIAGIGWNAVILDESTTIKDPRTGFSKFMVRNFRNVLYRYILTGLPDPEDILNYFQQLQFLDPTIFGCKDYWHFRNKYFKKDGFNYELTEGGTNFVKRQLAQHCFFLQRKEAGVGGDKIYEKILINQTPKLNKIFRTVEKELLLEVDGKEIRSTSYKPVAFYYLSGLCGGFAGKELVFTRKIKKLKELLEGRFKDQPIIIWAIYIQELILIKDNIDGVHLIYGGIKQKVRRELQRAFQEGNVNRLAINPTCVKYGTDYSRANTQIRYSRSSSLEVNEQSTDRLVDTGTHDDTLTIDLLVRDSIDEDIYMSIINKENYHKMWKRIIKRLQGGMYEERCKGEFNN